MAEWRKSHARGPLPKKLPGYSGADQKGVCCLKPLGKCITKDPKWARHQCKGCGPSPGAWYHEACFWNIHSCIRCA